MARMLARFEELWRALLTTPIHLDSALAKLAPEDRAILAEIVPAIMRAPIGLARVYGIGVPTEGPWTLPRAELARWKPACELARAMLDDAGPPRKVIATRADYPPRIVAEIEHAVDAVLASLAEPPPLSLRSRRALGPVALRARLLEGDPQLRLEASRVAPFGLRLLEHRAVSRHAAFAEGAFEVQDEGSQVMALFALWPEVYGSMLRAAPGAAPTDAKPIAPPRPPSGMIVVDACAGAGGKTLAIADALEGRGRVYAYDRSARRIGALKDRARRAGLTNVQAMVSPPGGEHELARRFAGTADLVLIDAPCSGWGVLRRNPDIKWRLDETALARLPSVQREILEAYAPLVAPKGRLVYGTCTFRRAETTEVMDAFLGEGAAFKRVTGGFLGPGPSDGFFMQSLVRSE
jgi:16S rRNA C967 or C1407 C5-methylase (RsmB/RsmF family)